MDKREGFFCLWEGMRLPVRSIVVCVFVYALFVHGSIAQAMTEALSYAGKVVNPDGTQMTSEQASCIRALQADTCDFRARIYTDASGGQLVWEETFHNVEIADSGGSFSLMLSCSGDFSACEKNGGPDFASDALFIEIAFDPSGNADFVEGETFAPRSQLGAVAYAFYAKEAQTFQGLLPSSFVRTDQDSTVADDARLTVDGELAVKGNLSIADTQIMLDGSATDFSVAGDFSLNVDDFFLHKLTGAIGVGTRTPDAQLSVRANRDAPLLSLADTTLLARVAPTLRISADFPTETLFALSQTTDSAPRLAVDASGTVRFGDGVQQGDATLYRAAPATLKTDGNLRIAGAVSIGTDDATYPVTTDSGAHLTVGGVWTNASDVRLKENFTSVDGATILRKIAQLDITQWNYKSEDDSVRHIGPTAQDFYALFGLGGSDTSISTIDPASIALIGVQELAVQQEQRSEDVDAVRDSVEVLRAENAQKDKKIAQLEREVAQLKEYYATLADAYIALDPAQFAGVSEEERVVAHGDDKGREGGGVDSEGTTSESASQDNSENSNSTEGGESDGDSEQTPSQFVDERTAQENDLVRESRVAEGRILISADARSERTVFVPFADMRNGDSVTIVRSDTQEEGNEESVNNGQRLNIALDHIIAGEGFVLQITGTMQDDLSIQWRRAIGTP